MAKICQLITPPSEADANLEQYEYMLVFVNADGSLVQQLFYDREVNISVDSQVINRTSSENIGNIIVGETKEISLIAENITKNELDVLQNIAISQYVYRSTKAGALTKVAVNQNSFSYRNSNQRFNFEIQITLPERNLPN